MRSLTKTGIRILSAKYRSILIKCAIINASVFIGAFGATSAMAANVSNWGHYRGGVNNESDATIKVNADITYDGSAGTTNEINRSLSIIKNTEGNDTNLILDGKYSDVSQTKGLTVGTGGNLTLTNITMRNFKNTSDGGAIYNNGTSATINSIAGNFERNTAQNGGAIYNFSGTINIVALNNDIEFEGNYVTSDTGNGGAIWNTNGTVGLYAGEGHSITFVGGEETDKYDIDGIYNVGTLNINGDGVNTPYTGTVNLQNVAGTGTTNIYGGTVNANANIEQDIINVNSGATLASNTAGVEIKADGTNGNLINDGTINITGANSRFGADHLTNNATVNITGANSLLETSTLTNNGTIDTVSLLSNSLNNNGSITTSGGIEAIIQNNEGGSITFNGDNVKLMILTNSGTAISTAG